MANLKDWAKRWSTGASRAAEAFGLGKLVAKKPQQWKVTGKCSKRGSLYRRTIGYKKTGPFFYQNGGTSTVPRMVRLFVHSFLHATKGFRTKRTSGPNVILSNAVQNRRAYGPQAYGYQTQHGWRYSPRRAGIVVIPQVKNAHKIDRAGLFEKARAA